jgi:ABC-type antimicrobial peptide transport system permease subunit
VQTVFLTQGALLGVIATLVGVPIGLLVARLAWRAVTDDLGGVVTSSVPWPTVGLTALSGVVAPVIIAWLPGRRAAGGVPADRLRAE